MDCSPPASSVHRISQARILEWVAISFSRGSTQPKGQTMSLSSPACWQVDSLPLSHLGSLKLFYKTPCTSLLSFLVPSCFSLPCLSFYFQHLISQRLWLWLQIFGNILHCPTNICSVDLWIYSAVSFTHFPLFSCSSLSYQLKYPTLCPLPTNQAGGWPGKEAAVESRAVLCVLFGS